MATFSAHHFSRQLKHLEHDVAVVVGNWAIGATGAVGAQTGARGATLTRTGVGTYTFQLVDSDGNAAKCPAILWVDFKVVEADANPADDTDAYLARPLTHDATTGAITFQTFDEALVARDPASGAYIMAFAVVKLSSVS